MEPAALAEPLQAQPDADLLRAPLRPCCVRMSRHTGSVRPAVINHVFKSLIDLTAAAFLGYLAMQFGFFDERMKEQGVQLGFAAGFGSVALLLAFAGARNVHALFRPPALELSFGGIGLRSWRGVGFAGFFLPYYRMREHFIAWADFNQVETFTYRVNGIPTQQELRIHTKQGLVSFGWDVFSPNVARIQRAILDYIDELFRGPRRAAARLPDLQRLRWQQPLVLQFKVTPFWLPLLALAGAAVAGYAASVLPQAGDWPGIVAVACLLGMLAAGGRWWQSRRNAVVEFRSDGLATGPSVNALRVIPWADIQFVRPQTFTSTFGWGSSGTPALVGLELRRRDGGYFSISGLAAAELERLLALLEPPLDAVIAAQERIAHGEAPEVAAQGAGLAPR